MINQREHPITQSIRNQLVNRNQLGRRLVAAALIGCAAASCPASTSADHPRPINQIGRWLGYGWGDGYHACQSSGLRWKADLPPNSYSTAFGNPRHVHPASVGDAHVAACDANYYDKFDATSRMLGDGTASDGDGTASDGDGTASDGDGTASDEVETNPASPSILELSSASQLSLPDLPSADLSREQTKEESAPPRDNPIRPAALSKPVTNEVPVVFGYSSMPHWIRPTYPDATPDDTPIKPDPAVTSQIASSITATARPTPTRLPMTDSPALKNAE